MSDERADKQTGAEHLVSTLADCGVTACFANPGTSEMHLVTALDGEPRIRSVLCLFEGVATGAADGFARIAGGLCDIALPSGQALVSAPSPCATLLWPNPLSKAYPNPSPSTAMAFL